jgi:hypothetical protein
VREGVSCQGGVGSKFIHPLRTFRYSTENLEGLIPVELFDELLADAKSITTEGTGGTRGSTGETVRSFIVGTRKRRGQECPRHTSHHYFFSDDW